MCGFFNAPFCHLVSKKNFFFEKKNQIGEGGIRREGILQILLADIFFKCFRQHSTFYHIFFFSSLIFFMFHQKRNKNQKTTLNQREKFFWKKKLLYTKKWHRFFHGLARKNNSIDNSSNNCVSQQARKFKNVQVKKTQLVFINQINQFHEIVIFYTEILTRKVVLWCFISSEKIHNSTFLVKISVKNVIFSNEMEK